MTHPKPWDSTGSTWAAPLHREKQRKRGEKSMEKPRNEAIWNASILEFSKVFLAASLEQEETAV